MVHQDLDCLCILRFVERRVVEADSPDLTAVRHLRQAVDVVDVRVTDDHGVESVDPLVIQEGYDDSRADVVAVQRAGIEEDVRRPGEANQDRLAVTNVKACDAQVVAMDSLPLLRVPTATRNVNSIATKRTLLTRARRRETNAARRIVA